MQVKNQIRNNKIDFRKLIFEFTSVSFAVLVALVVNQWRADYNNKKIAEKAVDNIKTEIIENRDIMNKIIPNHQLVLNKIDSLLLIRENLDNDTTSIMPFNIILTNSSAWEMSKITNAVFYINFDTANKIAKVYNLQKYYESIIKQYFIKNSFSNKETDIDNFKKTKQFLETIIPLEENLKSLYNRLINEVLIK
jgi:hypothetical protein